MKRRPVPVAVALIAGIVPAVGAGGARAGAVPVSSGTWTMTSDVGDYVGAGQSYSFSAPTDLIELGVRNNGEAVAFMNGSDFWTADFSAPGGAPLQPGGYDNAQRFADATHPGLDVFGAGRGCNTISGQFTVLSVSYGPYGYLQSLHLTFEQRCGVSTAALRGEIDLVAPPAPPPVTVDVTFDAAHVSLDSSDGTLKLRGTVSCSQVVPSNSAVVSADVSEQTKNGLAFGGGSVFPLSSDCSTTPIAWAIKAKSLNGIQYTKGTLQITLIAQAEDAFYSAYHDNSLIFASDTISQAVTVKPG
jgi:hypothetical protein